MGGNPDWLPPKQAAYLRELQATDPAAVPWVFVRLLAKNGLYRYLVARDRARSPEESEKIAQTVAARPRDWSLANFDDSSIHECESAAVALFEKIATVHGEDEARRIFKELGKERTSAEKVAPPLPPWPALVVSEMLRSGLSIRAGVEGLSRADEGAEDPGALGRRLVGLRISRQATRHALEDV
jgi:hypothetical protein